MFSRLFRLRMYIGRFLHGFLVKYFWKRYWIVEARGERALGQSNHETMSGTERATLFEALGRAYPFKTLLEVGCGYGQNFALINDLFVDLDFLAIDVDQEMVGYSTEVAKAITSNKVVVQPGNICDLSEIATNSIEVVFVAAALLYLDDQSIIQAMREILRVSSKKVILLEQHLEGQQGARAGRGFVVRGVNSSEDYWLRNYRSLIEDLSAEECPIKDLSIEPVERPIWPDEQWLKYAHLIEISL